MKTRDFIERVEALDFVGKAEKGMSGLIGFPNKNGEALISVNEDLAYHLTTEYKASGAKNIVLGARHLVENMREHFGDSTHPHTQGALYQAEHDLEVIEYVVSMYEVEIEEESE